MQIKQLITYLLFAFSLLSPPFGYAQEWIYTTVTGDNLWNLSAQHLDRVTRFKQIQALNNVENPKKMQPGTRLRIPLKWIKSNPVPARIDMLQGQAQLIRADGSTVVITETDTLVQLGEKIRTGDNSSVAIRFADDTRLTLHSNSLISFDHLSAHGSTGMVDSRMNLIEGRMDTQVTPATGPGSRFQIQTPSAISAVRGTEYRASVDSQGQGSNIEVLHGSVAVKGANKQRLIKAGFGTRIETGKPPIPPKKLLPAPEVKPVNGPVRTINHVLEWKQVNGADDYRIEISDHRDFETLLWQQISDQYRAALPDLPDGKYFARIRGVDSLGLEGKNRIIELELDARPQAPIPLSPADTKLFRGTAPVLQWTDSAEAHHYHLEIATDSQFEKLVTDRNDISGTRFDSSELAVPGSYFWRLTSITADGEIGPPGVTRNWEIKPVPAEVNTEMTEAEDGLLVASWPRENSQQTYQVQLAFDPQFRQLEIDRVISNSSISFEPVKGKHRYLRVRAIEPDGYEGPWGATQKVVGITDYRPLGIWGAAVMILLL